MSLGTCGGVTDGIAYPRSRAAVDAGRGRVDVPRRPEDRHPVGQGGQAQRHPNPGWPPSLPRVGGPCAAAGADSLAAYGRLTPTAVPEDEKGEAAEDRGLALSVPERISPGGRGR